MFKTDDRGARAIGRVVFGAILIAGAATLVSRGIDDVPLEAGKVLAATWCVAFIAAWVTRQLVSAARPEARDLGAFSYLVPAFGIALLLPLTIHLPFALAFGVTAKGFDDWTSLAMWITPVAHVAFAGMTAVRAYQIAKGYRALATRTIFVATIVVSAVPFALMMFIPPLLVGFTGIPIVFLLDRMPTWIEREETAPLPRAIVV